MDDKFILDACCGGRCFWFNKHHPNTLYIDIRKEERGISKLRPNFEVNPDIIMDFTKMNFPDKKFKLVVWDPPHLISLGFNSEINKKYGGLNPDNWEYTLKKGFSECWRVLEDYGILIVKWNEQKIKLDKLLSLFTAEPLFGHTTGSKSKTKWLSFMKIPEIKK